MSDENVVGDSAEGSCNGQFLFPSVLSTHSYRSTHAGGINFVKKMNLLERLLKSSCIDLLSYMNLQT